MTAFLVTYTTASGRRREFTLEAESPALARRTLRQRGILPNTLIRRDPAAVLPGKAGPGRFNLGEWLERNVTIREKALFASKLSTLLDAGVPILRSLDLLHTQQKGAKFRRALTGMTQDVNQGESLANAMRRWPQVFDDLSIAMVEAGEAGGVLDETLKRLARLLEEVSRLQNQIRGALGYPVTVLVIAMAIFLGMTLFVIPTFASVYEQLDAELPWFTQMMVELSKLLRSSFALVLLAAVLLIGFLLARYHATPVGRRQVDGMLLKTPLFGDLVQKSATAQFCRTMSSLSRAGVPILMSLEIVRDTTSNRVIGDAIMASRTEVSEGIPLSTALSLKKVFPDMAVSMLAVGEETGEMDAMLSKVADFYEDEVSSTVKALTSMLEPVMIVLVGVIVGSILLAMYLPMFSIYDKIR
jgi:type IV pilus assembly protein PilC